MTPTAQQSAEVTCCKCSATFTGNIDQIFAAGWNWYSDHQQRYFWCPTCAELPEFLPERQKARAKREVSRGN